MFELFLFTGVNAQEYSKLISEANKLYVWDIVKLQSGALTGYILGNKQIFIVKKESQNMERLLGVFKKEKKLQDKKVLIIDDEADQAGVSFVADKGSQDGIELAKVAKKSSEFRSLLKGKNSYLQVTATPYSLYLQPENLNINQQEYAPLRPAFTHVLHPHPFYIGGGQKYCCPGICRDIYSKSVGTFNLLPAGCDIPADTIEGCFCPGKSGI